MVVSCPLTHHRLAKHHLQGITRIGRMALNTKILALVEFTGFMQDLFWGVQLADIVNQSCQVKGFLHLHV
ncbi:Uncharacterised protein [Vibrio cholerae]|uniref:Uncharacterized protein n=1 Tax=Vibrio cholerae TaxID=666 RepID=A0A655QJX4_VIBCL|nr:Uncharacterised protein [Vibrio cholerae]CSA72014.1 Uncharacterised protein [Vibrio cholerae]CSB90865.1 Uncharacterised protein [Vibrio cholerae]